MIKPLTYTDRNLPPIGPDSPATEVWRDHDGTPCAFGGSLEGRYRMHVPRVGSFLFHPDVSEVEVAAEEGASEALVQDAYLRMVLPMALQVAGQEVLHGSAVLTPQGVLALCAVSETGKSTLAYGLAERGHTLWADDAVVFDSSADPTTVTPTPFAVRLREASARFFGQVCRADTHTIGWRGPALDKPAPLAAVCLLERLPSDADGRAEALRLNPGEAFGAILPHAYCFDLSNQARKKRMMLRYLALARTTPIFKVRFSSGLENLKIILDALENAAEHGKAPASAV